MGSALHKKKPFFSALHKLMSIPEGKPDVFNVLSPKCYCVSVPYKFPPQHSFCINSSSQSHMTEQPRFPDCAADLNRNSLSHISW